MRKEELVELVKRLVNEEDLSKHLKDVSIVKEEARRMSYRDDDNFAESKLTDEFNKYYAILEKRESSLASSILDEKKVLIEKARNVLNEKNFNKALNDLNKLFDDLKKLGRSNKEDDDKFYQELKEIRETINNKRQAYFDNLKIQNENNQKAKEEIVKEAKETLKLESIKEADAKFNLLMNKWKTLGFTGNKELDDSLWNAFNELRQEFYKKKKAFYDEMQKIYDEKANRKEEIINRAKKILANSDFTEDEVKAIKDLRNEWKEIGFAGKDKEDKLWNDFNEIINKYFEEMKFYK